MTKKEAQRLKLKICLTHLTEVAANRTGRTYRISPKERSTFVLETQEIINKEIEQLVNSLIPTVDNEEKQEIIPVLTF